MKIRKKEALLSLKRTISISALFIVFAGLFILQSCDKGDIPEKEDDRINITGVSIPSTLESVQSGEITINGKGFKTGDQIQFTSVSDESKKYTLNITSVTDQTAAFTLPPDISTGRYELSVIRDGQSLKLGTLMLNIIVDSAIPDIPGMTVKGIVYSNGKGIPGVVVSDGFEVTQTDENGIYYLASEKRNGYVFISIPGNYEVPYVENMPQFFKRLSAGNTVEQKDFSLIETDNTNHVVIGMADWHLANRNNDLEQFTNGFLADVNETIAEYKAKGTKVYGLTLGDLSWDLYWYDNKFALPEYLVQMYKIDCPVFNMMGNHDNDPYVVGDWAAEQPYKSIVGPSYYSFNLGEVHYIVLDNTEYINTGGAQGKVGSRNYNTLVVNSQMDWLRKDLATIRDKNTPIVIGMHAPLYSNPAVNSSGEYQIKYALANGSAFVSALDGFTNVRVLSGHTHINYTIEPNPSLIEHNTAAVCATWWWTGRSGYAGNHICRDGSPGGYGVWEINGNDIEWYYKSIGYKRNYQFRAYDLNTVHITAAEHAPKSDEESMAAYSDEYASINNLNEVLLNIWGYDDKWDIEVKENGNNLNVSRVNVKDPLHIISYEALRLNVGSTPTSSFVTRTSSHMFKVKAASATSTLDIKVTDRFGNVYTEVMERPKPFTYSMR